MTISRKIKVLIVDDSTLMRKILSMGIASDSNIDVIALATDPYDARDKIIEYEPDVIICDIEMPKMNGIEFITKLMAQHPIPTIMVSTIGGAVFDALKAGAIDFVAKPDVRAVSDIEDFINELKVKIKTATLANISSIKFNNTQIIKGESKTSYDNKLIAIGASTGGTEAIHNLLRAIPNSSPGIVIAQHIPPLFSRLFAERLDSSLMLSVKEAKNGDIIESGHVYVAPGDEHIRIKRIGERFRIECFKGEKVNGHRPSVDVLFNSVAKEAGDNAIGVILTGMGYDGAKGMLAMRRKGAKTIGQDEKSCVVYGMPKVAYEIGAVEKQVALNNIPMTIYSML